MSLACHVFVPEFNNVQDILYSFPGFKIAQFAGDFSTSEHRVAEPHSSVAPSSGSGGSGVAERNSVGMGDAIKPKGVKVAVAVDVGRGVMLGKGVVVMEAVMVGLRLFVGRMLVGFTAFVLSVRGLVVWGVAGMPIGTGNIARQAEDASANTIIDITAETVFLHIRQYGGCPRGCLWCYSMLLCYGEYQC